MSLELITQEVKGMTQTIEQIKANAEKTGQGIEKATAVADELKKRLDEANFVSMEDVKSFQKQIQDEFQKQFDELAVLHKAANDGKVETKTVGQAFEDEIKGQYKQINGTNEFKSDLLEQLNHKNASIRIPLTAKNITLAGNLTGDPIATYSNRQAIFPSQKVNMRDLCRTINTATGLYVFYKETATTNNIYTQDEGSLKGENNYALAETKVVQDFIAGYSTFSKQLVNSLPFMTQTLPAMLTRDFFKAENSIFYNTIVGVAGTGASTGQTDVVKKFVEYAAYQRKQNYNTSFAIVDPNVYAALVNSTYTNGYYPGAGGLMWNGTSLTISGVPIIEASWANTTTVLFIDSDYLERVQVSGLAIALSYETDDNFKRNLVTARIECQEEINLMLAPSALYETLIA